MIPVGILTRDRYAYLDVTLKSLSGADLPEGLPVTVFDDCSQDSTTQRYYSTNERFSDPKLWPETKEWRDKGLDVAKEASSNIVGINQRLTVKRLGSRPVGVVRASCKAVIELFKRHPESPAVLLLQDDVVFNKDFYTRLLHTYENWSEYSSAKLGVLSGIKLNSNFDVAGKKIIQSGLTAQCLLITREAFTQLADFFRKRTQPDKRFDDLLCRHLRSRDLWCGCILPFVCQHVGVVSKVRPGRKWSDRKSGRIGYYAYPPYVMAEKVKSFR